MKRAISLKNLYAAVGLLFLLFGFYFVSFIKNEFTKLPSDFTYEADFESFDDFYDNENAIYLGEQESKSRFYYNVSSYDDKNLLVEHNFEVRQLNDALIFAAKRVYGIDTYTKEHVSNLGDKERSVGYLFAPPGIDTGSDFWYWPIKAKTPVQMQYKESLIKNGLELYKYEASYTADQTEDLSFLDGVPEIYGVLTDVTLELHVEPYTGRIVYMSDQATSWFSDAASKERLFPRNQFRNKFTELSYNYHTSEAQKAKNIILFFDYFIPGLIYGLSALFFFLSFIAYRNKSNRSIREIVSYKTLGASTLVFILCLIMTLYLWSLYKESLKNESIDLFRQETELIETAIENRANLYIGALISGVGLFNASDDVSRNEWKEFAEGLDLQENFPGIQGYGYSVLIPKNELDDHESQIRSEGFPEYVVKPEADKDEYTSIIYLEPFDERNIQAFGLDMTFEINRRTAMHLARDTGEPRMSGRVTLVQEIDEDVQPGFLLYVPQYNELSSKYNTVEERRENLVGYVYSPFRMRDFMSGLLGDRDLVLDFEIYDHTDSEDIYNDDLLMYSSKRSGESSLDNLSYLERESVIKIAEREWRVRYTPRQEFGLGLVKETSGTILLLSGILVSFFLSLIVYLLAISRQRAISIANEITKELKEKVIEIENAEQKTKAIIESMSDGLIVVDEDGDVMTVNKAFEGLTGLKVEDIIGKKLSDAVGMVDEHGDSIKKEDRPITKALESKQKIDNRNQVLEYKKKDGTAFPVAISISPIFIENNFVGAVEVFRDITKEYEVDKAKTEFVSLASHQLRTPLTAIRWYTEMLLSDDDDKLSEEKEGYVNEIRKGNHRMIDLVNALLNVSRIELGNFAVSTEDVNLREILSESLDDIKILIKDKDLDLIIDDGEAPETYKADPSLLRMVFQNLISNSFKYTDEGEIKVTVDTDRDSLRIVVSDTGHGIPKDQQDKIFKKLFRADNVKTLDTTGTGLGLYVIKAIIEEVSGSIDFESEEGKGTTFTVKLPLEGMKNIEGSKPLAV